MNELKNISKKLKQLNLTKEKKTKKLINLLIKYISKDPYEMMGAVIAIINEFVAVYDIEIDQYTNVFPKWVFDEYKCSPKYFFKNKQKK